MKAALVLEDGTVFEGLAFGAAGEAVGEAVCYTGVVGYQEVLTSPSYRGTLVALTYPIIGSYGVNPDDSESSRVQAAGVIIRDLSPHYSNFRATGAFEDFLVKEGVPGIRGVDTRALAIHTREHGEMKASIVTGDVDAKAVASRLAKTASPFGKDLAADAKLVMLGGAGGRKVVLLDAGATRSLLAQLADLGFSKAEGEVDAATALSAKPVGVIVTGGPGDPAQAKAAAALLAGVLGKTGVLGVGCGTGIVAAALGCAVARMKAGHHGVNHSVRDLETGRCSITAQHHSFVVAKAGKGVEVTHSNINDGTIEGIRCSDRRARGVQFEPARDDTGAPSAILERFLKGQDA